MKLSPDKIEQLSAALVDQLAEIDGVLFRSDDSHLRLAAQQIITAELLVEEQLDAEIGFEGGDVIAQRRLRDVERLGCPRQHAGIGDGDEIPELSQAERH